MLSLLRQARYPVEFALLAVLCLSLPLLEAPKNLAWIAYAAAWVVNRARARDFGGAWDRWDTLIAAWIASGYVVAAFSGLQQSEWKGAGDLLRYGSLLWMVRRARYAEAELRALMGVLVAATVAGLAFGLWRLLSGRGGSLQLHSVGHVNHTAIYIAIMLGVAASWVFAQWHAWQASRRAAGVAVCVLFLVSLVMTQSRGAVGIGLVAIPLVAAGWWPRSRVPLVASTVAMAIAVAIAVGFGAEVVRKQQDREKEANVLAFRDGVWRSAIVAWERFPVFGVGMDNYSGITPARLEAWRREAGKPYVATDYARFPHGHSLFFNTLAERGAFGAGVLAAVMLAWGAALVRRRPLAGARSIEWLAWGSAASAWIVTVGAGAVNTTLHHEHGMLATLLLAIWLSCRSGSGASGGPG